MSTIIPRFLLPQGASSTQGLRTRALYLQPIPSRKLPVCRNASSNPPKQIVLEKPERFNPPSHPARLHKKPSPRSYPGPRLSESQVEEQKTKQYPNSFPPEGTWRYWFLTNRRIHVYITLVCHNSVSKLIALELERTDGLLRKLDHSSFIADLDIGLSIISSFYSLDTIFLPYL